jgi:hypothetical protein
LSSSPFPSIELLPSRTCAAAAAFVCCRPDLCRFPPPLCADAALPLLPARLGSAANLGAAGGAPLLRPVLLSLLLDEFSLDTRSTIGVEFATKTVRVDGKLVKAQNLGHRRLGKVPPCFAAFSSCPLPV